MFGLLKMRITETLSIEHDRRGYQEASSDCKAYGLKEHGLTWSDFEMLCIIVAMVTYVNNEIHPM